MRGTGAIVTPCTNSSGTCSYSCRFSQSVDLNMLLLLLLINDIKHINNLSRVIDL